MNRNYKPIQLLAGFALAISFFSTPAFAQIGKNDSTFNTPDSGPNNWYKSTNYSVRASAAQADNNKFVLGGEFTTYNGETHNYIVRTLADGSIDNSFNSGTGLNGTVSSVAIQTDNKIIVGGAFTNYNGTSVPGFIRILEDGTLDSLFTAGNTLGNSTKIKIQSDGKILALSSFGLARINADGSIDSTFTNP